MISLLSRIFIKDFKNYSDTKVRSQYGILCGIFGIFLNILLSGVKFLAGIISSSVAITADAVNNLSDAASSLVQVLGFKLSSKKPDREHPFGHGRIEYISGLIISFLILLMAVEIIKSSIESLIEWKSLDASIPALIIMASSILVKFYMFIYNHSIAKKINSVSMEATAKDSLSDTISTFVVILSVIASRFTAFPVDGVAGFIVGLFIFKTGISAARETIAPLLGTSPAEEFVKNIEKEVMSHKPIIGMHDLVVHDYGPGRLMISLHAEVPGNYNIYELHDVIDNVEVEISKKFNCAAVIHMDPIDTENKKLGELKKELLNILSSIDNTLHAHDVRMVPGTTHTNLIFDVVKPFSCSLSDEELCSQIQKKFREKYSDINCVITVDCSFVKN